MMTACSFLPSPPSPRRYPAAGPREFGSAAVTDSLPSAAALRQSVIAAAHTVVVKVGTRVLTHESGTLDLARIELLAEEIQSISAAGRRVVLVSSGAVGAGLGLLGLKSRPTDLAKLQAV